MVGINILGGGNLASHLVEKFLSSPLVRVVGMYNRHMSAVARFSDRVYVTDSLDKLPKAQVYILSVSDDAITTLSSKLSVGDALVVHTSGATSTNALKGCFRKGVLYPVQTFSKACKLDFSKVPIVVEAGGESDARLLEKIAWELSPHCYQMSYEKRKKIHLAAVFVNNFVNHLYQIGDEICRENEIPFAVLKSLISETALKVQSLRPVTAQTGPAVRGDRNTIERHLSDLNNDVHKRIYKLLSHSIMASRKGYKTE